MTGSCATTAWHPRSVSGRSATGDPHTTVTVSEPWESLLSFEVEFATDPPIAYDLETMSTDSLGIGL